MKFGPRKPSIKRRVKARTTGKMKRRAKSAINPLYGKKGTGMIRNPKKSVYNKVYNKTTYDSCSGCGSCAVLLLAFLLIFLIVLTVV